MGIVHSTHWCHENEATRPYDNCYNTGGRFDCPMCYPGGQVNEGTECAWGSTVYDLCKIECLPGPFPAL